MHKRHCMIAHTHYPIGEARVQRESEALIDRGYEVDVICLRRPGEPSHDEAHGVQIYRLPIRRHKGHGVLVQFVEYLAFFVLAFFKLTALYLQRRYQIIQVHNLPDFLVFAAIIPKLLGAKVILDIRDVMPEFYQARFNVERDTLPLRLIRWQEKLSCAFADHVITVTEHWRQALVRRGVPLQKTSVVMNLADEEVFRNGHSLAPAAKDNSRFRLIYHGQLTYRYGADLIIRALTRLVQTIPYVHLLIHGWGEFLCDLQQLTKELDLDDYVHFSTELIPIEQLPALISTADVGIVPYRRDVFTDGILPTKLMEYVALGVPVVASRTPMIEAYFDETMVEFFPPGDVESLADCILKLYYDPERRATLARNADAFYQRFDWRSQAASYCRLIDDLASGQVTA